MVQQHLICHPSAMTPWERAFLHNRYISSVPVSHAAVSETTINYHAMLLERFAHKCWKKITCYLRLRL
jgi:hypothetical protein